MPRKIFLEGDGFQAGAAIPLLVIVGFVTAMFFLVKSKQASFQQQTTAPSQPSQPVGDDKNSEQKKKKKKEEKKKAKPMITHNSAPVPDQAILRARQQEPDNPIYRASPIPENLPLQVDVPPLPPPRSDVKGAHKPYANGQPLPRPATAQPKGVSFVDGSREDTPGAAVTGMAAKNPFGVGSQKIENKDHWTHAVPGTPGGPSYRQAEVDGRKAAKRPGWRTDKQPPCLLKAEIVAMTQALKNPPVSMPEDDVEWLLEAVDILCAEPGTAEFNQACREEEWHGMQGTYPRFAKIPLDIVAKSLAIDKRGAELVGAVMQVPTGQAFMKRFGKTDPTNYEFVTSWFLDHYRLATSRIAIDTQHFPLVKIDGTKASYRLLKWLEMLGESCASVRLLSPRGLDIPGLTGRVSCWPINYAAKREGKEIVWNSSIAIFLPASIGKESKNPREWYTQTAGAGDVWRSAMAIEHNNRMFLSRSDGIRIQPRPYFRRMTFRPGWNPGAIAKLGLENATNLVHDVVVPGSDGIPMLIEWPKGIEDTADVLTPENVYNLLMNPIQLLEPTVIVFDRRAHFAWANQSVRPDGFEPGDIPMCLKVLGKIHVQSRYQRLGMVDTPGVQGGHDHIKGIDFNEIIPLEYTIEKQDEAPANGTAADTATGNDAPAVQKSAQGKKIYKFPSLQYFPGLICIGIPYVTMSSNPELQTAAIHPEATAILALSASLGLFQQLKERNIIIIVKFKAKPPGCPPDKLDWTPEQWSELFVQELRVFGEKEGLQVDEWKNRFLWTIDDQLPFDMSPRFELKVDPPIAAQDRPGPNFDAMP